MRTRRRSAQDSERGSAVVAADLHDEVDLREDLDQRAQEIVERVIRTRLADALELAEEEDGEIDIEEALELLASWVEDELTDLSTEAVQKGAAVLERVVRGSV